MLTVVGYEVLTVPALFLGVAAFGVWCVWGWMSKRYDDK